MNKNSCRCFLTGIVVLNVALSGPNAFGQQDELFSSVRASSAFSDGSSSSPASTLSTGTTNRLTSAEALVQALQKAEFTATASGNRAAKTTKQLDAWQFPVLVTISDNEQDLLISIGLRAVNDSQKIPTARLILLLEANQNAMRASFVLNRDQGRIELRGQVENPGDRDGSLRAEISRLAILARDMETLWNLDEASGGRPVGTAGLAEIEAVKTTSTAAAPGSTGSGLADSTTTAISGSSLPTLDLTTLHGRWSASRSSTEAFAMQLSSDSTFVLVSVINGKQLRSTGRFSLQGDQLTLDGSDGTKIVGAVKRISTDEFQLTLQTSGASAAALSFRRAK